MEAKTVGLLEAGDLAEAWSSWKGWYTAAADWPPKPCHETMEKQTAERVDLYEKLPPLGDPILINVELKEVPDACSGKWSSGMWCGDC